MLGWTGALRLVFWLGCLVLPAASAEARLAAPVVPEAPAAAADVAQDVLPAAAPSRQEAPPGTVQRISDAADRSLQRLWRLIGALPLFLVALGVAWLAWKVGGWASRHMPARTRLGRNPLLAEMLRQAVRGLFLLAGLLLGLEILGATSLATALLGSAGVVGIALGFALRDLLENYIASVLLSLRQPFAADDVVLIDGHEGTVVGMNSRATILMTPDGNHLRLPNSQVFKSVMLNYTRNGRRRFDFTLTLMPGCDPGGAMRAGLQEVAATPDVLGEPAPFVQLQEASPRGTVLQFFGWVDQRTGNFGAARSEALRRAWERLVHGGFDLGPPTYRLDTQRDARSPPDTTPVGVPPAKSGETPLAIQAAVAKTREEMGERDLLRSDARKE